MAVIWPADRAPLLVAAYYQNANAAPELRGAVLAQAGRIAAGF